MIALCAGLALTATVAHAEFSIEGDATALRVEATEAPIEEIFSALGAIYGVTISATRLPDRPVTGVYTGSLQRVVAGMLERYDYVLSVTADTIEISYLQPRGGPGVRLAHIGKPAMRASVRPK